MNINTFENKLNNRVGLDWQVLRMTERRIQKKILNSKSKQKRKAEIKRGITGYVMQKEGRRNMGGNSGGAWEDRDRYRYPHENGNVEGRRKRGEGL
jgi:hypothetical protein